MSILSQIGIAVLIITIILILIRSDKKLVEASREGEYFVDEWALKEERKRQIIEEEKQRKKQQRKDMKEAGLKEANDIAGEGLTLALLDEARKPVKRVPVLKIPFYIGRDSGNDLVMDDLFVAKRHCRIVEGPQGLMMEDSGSRNKLLSDGRPAAKIYLKDGLVLGIGSKELLVEMR